MRKIAATLLLCCACTSSTGVPSDASIRCTDGESCPSGFVCNPNSSLCQPEDNLDFEAPTVEAFTATPRALGVGRELEVTLTVNEALGAPPSARLSNGVTELPLQSEQTGPRTYVFRGLPLVDATTARLPDGPYSILLTLVDESGNRFEGARDETVVVDSVPPQPLAETARIILTPDPESNPLREVDAWKRSTDLELSFIASEPSEATLVFLDENQSPSDAGLLFTARNNDAESKILVVDESRSSPVDGTYTVAAELRDLAGNQSLSTLIGPDGAPLTLTVDLTPPEPPNVDEADAVRFIRAPWGDSSGGESRSLLSLTEGALETDAILIAYADDAGEREISRFDTRQNTDGAPLDLRTIDRPRLFVQTVDRAGNASAVRGVRDIEWQATLVGKVAGSVVQNPHRFLTRFVDSPAAQIFGEDEVGAAQGIGVDDENAFVTTGRPSFERVQSAEQPERRTNSAAVYDPLRDVVILYGGQELSFEGGPPPSDELWEIRNNAYRRITPRLAGGEGPPAASDLSLVFDPTRGVPILGVDGDGTYWEYDGAGSFYIRKSVSDGRGDGSPGRGAQLFWDEQLRAISAFEDATTRWHLEDDDWLRAECDATCVSSSPNGTTSSPIAYDTETSTLFLWGPDEWLSDEAPDRALWRLRNGAWEPACTDACSLDAPALRRAAAFTYDANGKRLLLFGGVDPKSSCPFGDPSFHDLWSFDGERWTCISPEVCTNRTASGCTDFFDPCNTFVCDVPDGLPVSVESGPLIADGSGGLHLLGGESFFDSAPRYYFDGERWGQTTDTTPSAEAGGAAIYDPSDASVLTIPAEGRAVWRFHAIWTRECSGCAPSANREAAFGYRVDAGQMVYHEGFSLSDTPVRRTWTYNRDGRIFAPVCSDCGPTRSVGATLIPEPGGDGLVVIDGADVESDANSTWRFDGSSWSVLCPSASCTPAMSGANRAEAAYSSSDVFLFVETVTQKVVPSDTPRSCSESDVRSYGDSTWPLVLDGAFVNTVSVGLTYDPLGATYWRFGGTNNNECVSGSAPPLTNSLRYWDGAAWRSVDLGDPHGSGQPMPTLDPLMVGRMDSPLLVFGGAGGDRDTWVLHTAGTKRPEHLVRFNLASATIPEDAAVLELDASWNAGCHGEAPDPSDGCALRLWTGRRFEGLVAHEAPLESPSTLRWSSALAPVTRPLDELPVGPTRDIILSLRPRAANGGPSTPAQVATESVSLTVRYRLAQ